MGFLFSFELIFFAIFIAYMFANEEKYSNKKINTNNYLKDFQKYWNSLSDKNKDKYIENLINKSFDIKDF